MILIHFIDGSTQKISSLCEYSSIDSRIIQQRISRMSFIDGQGHRVDLLSRKSKFSRVWIEAVKKNNDIKAERVCFLVNKSILKATHYFSDNRVIIDLY